MPILMLLVAPALAGDLTWRWTPGQAVRYHAETLLTTPASPIYMAPRNDEARATQVEVVLDLSCTAQVHGKGWDLACAIEKAKVAGVAVTGEQ